LQVGFGVCVIVVAQIAGSFQGVFEEHLLQGRNISAKKTLGMEGLWGVLLQGAMLLAFAIMPGSDGGSIEDLSDTVSMWANSGDLRVLGILFVLSVGLCNICCLNVTKRISAVTRCLVDCCRTMVIWLASLGLYYSGYESWGAPWAAHSWLQLVGFVFLLMGTLIYNAAIHIPGFRIDHVKDAELPPAAWSPRWATMSKGLDDWEFSPRHSPAPSPDGNLASHLLDPTKVEGDLVMEWEVQPVGPRDAVPPHS